MTVKALIEKLKTLDQDTEIKVNVEYMEGGWGYDDIYKIKREDDADGAYVIYA